MNQNSLFSSGFSSSNPFNMNNINNTIPALDNSLLESYAKLEALKQKQSQINNISMQQKQTVFTDISEELKGLSEDELNFIMNSNEYIALNQKYQNEFSQFLISKFSDEYLQTNNSRTLEEMLHTIKQQKEKYKEKFAIDINEIKDQNKELINKNSELENSNKELKDELLKIQERLKWTE